MKCNCHIQFLFLSQNINELRHDFQQCGILKRVDSDEPVQPLFKLRLKMLFSQ